MNITAHIALFLPDHISNSGVSTFSRLFGRNSKPKMLVF